MPLPWQRSKPLVTTTAQPVSGELRAVLFRACTEPTCPHFQEPRTSPELVCAHQSNVDQGIVASFDKVVERSVAYQSTGTPDAVVAAANRVADAMDAVEREGGSENAARLAQYLEQLRFEVKHG